VVAIIVSAKEEKRDFPGFDEALTLVEDRAMQNKKILAFKPRSSLQEGGNASHTSLIKLAEEFVDAEVDVVTSRFPQLTSVSHEKMYCPPWAPTF
jgi:hypothetical protein